MEMEDGSYEIETKNHGWICDDHSSSAFVICGCFLWIQTDADEKNGYATDNRGENAVYGIGIV